MKNYSELILCDVQMPPDDYAYKCVKVGYDDKEVETVGGDVHDVVESIQGWKKLLTPLEDQNNKLKEEIKKLREALEEIQTKSERVTTDTPFTTFKIIINIVKGALK